MDFFEPINPLGKRKGARDIITPMDYLTRRAKEAQVKDYIAANTAKFLFNSVATRFRFPNILKSDQGTYFSTI